ncbi:MAG: hypothetical protein HQ521_06455, partial [Bacteroidetes bacterium]|nr:hypothetical protein [Bacteroidota bacterium]
MNQFFTLKNIRLNTISSIFAKIGRNLNLYIIGLILLPNLLMGEGSKEIYVANYNTHFYLCSNFLNQCNTGQGDRYQFAVYGCNEEERLYFNVLDDEIVYLGFNGDPNSGSSKIVYRIIQEGNPIPVFGQNDFPVTALDDGYIPFIANARIGPNQLAGVGGYDAIEFTPPGPGKYYIEFDRVYTATGLPNRGGFDIDLLDITVANTITSEVKLGRLYSQAWQMWEQGHCSAKFYIYSTDSIVTSLELNDMQGGIWVTFCNSYGCVDNNNFEVDRMSVNYSVYVPEYDIFLNEPDDAIFPPASSLGTITAPVTGVAYCSGMVDFNVQVDKPGNVDIELVMPPYATRTLTENVEAGQNLLTWDGLDNNGVQVPNGTDITFTVSYINGLTNLPAYDVEQNSQGFVIELVAPAPEPSDPPLLVYWDDSNIGGGTNFTGCLSTSFPWVGCHNFSGNLETVNTWWYNVSTTSAPVVMDEERSPDLLVFDQSTANYCAGSVNIPISVAVDPNTEIYNWDFTGNDVSITQVNTSDNFITIDFGPLATTGDIMVWGTNASCGNGDTSYLFIGIQELPTVNAGLDDTICVNQSVTLAGSRSFSNSSTWTTPGDGVFSDVTSLNSTYTPGTADLLAESVILILEANPIAPCAGIVEDTMLLTFDPLPIAYAGDDTTVCENQLMVLSGIRTNSNSSLWSTAGDGTFDDASLESATYTPGSTDLTNGSVVLTFTAYAINPCTTPDSQTLTLSFDLLPTANAGFDEVICVNQNIVLSGSSARSTSILWTTTGNGIFDDASLPNAEYIPGSDDLLAGMVNLVLTANPIAPCADVARDTMMVSFTPLPISLAGVDSTICENATIILYGDTTFSSTVQWTSDGDGTFDNDLLISATYT